MSKKRTIWVIFWMFLWCLSFFFIVLWQKENKHIVWQMKELKKQQIIKKSKTISTELSEDTYLKVDFAKLQAVNSDVVGWIILNGTTIDYPIVKAKNNHYYLNHSLDKSWSDGGWIFMDYRVNEDFTSKNTIIYGHSRYDGSFFGTMRNIFKKDWQNDSKNHVLTIITPKERSLWQVFSIYTIPKEKNYIQTDFLSLNSFDKWITLMKQRSIFLFSTEVEKTDQVITLSSCYNTNGVRMVLHAKKIKTLE